MSKYQIESGIPIPEHGNAKYPWAELQVGQSFVADKPQKTISSTATGTGRRLGRKFTVRAIDDNHSRVWRTE